VSTVVTIRVDLAKTVFQLHGIDEGGRTALRRRLSRHEIVSYFAKPTVLSHRNESLLGSAPLGARAYSARTFDALDLAAIRQTIWCASKARITSGGRSHPESCRLIW